MTDEGRDALRRSTISWPPLRGGCRGFCHDWGSVLPPEVRSWMLRVMAPLCRGSCQSAGLTKGVNAADTKNAIVRSSPTRLLPYTPSVCPKGQPLSSGMTATGSHNHFYSLRGAQPPTQGRQTPRRKFFRNSCGRGMPPPLHSKTILPALRGQFSPPAPEFPEYSEKILEKILAKWSGTGYNVSAWACTMTFLMPHTR